MTILLKVNWDQVKELNWKKIVTYSFGSLIAIIGIGILITVITLVLLQKYDDRYRNSHPEEFGMISLQSFPDSTSNSFTLVTQNT
ncbi:hypothetical protein [Bacillus sp. AK031]